ncbi:MAG: DUF6496 domain-containing protein [Candidatus Tumulicola sp.]
MPRAAAASKKTGTRKKTRKYSPRSGSKVERAMDEMKHGKLTSGRSGKKVTSRKQAIAIGLSEARRGAINVPRRLRSPRGLEPRAASRQQVDDD